MKIWDTDPNNQCPYPIIKYRLYSYLRNLVLRQLQKESWKNINSYKTLSDRHFKKIRYWSRYLKKCDQNSQILAQNRPTATLAWDLLIGITRPFFIRFWYSFFNACFFEKNWMMTRSKLYLLRYRFWFLTLFLLRGLTWATLCTRTQIQPKNVGTCPGLPLQLISQNWICHIYDL